MEARATFDRTSVWRSLLAALVVIAVICLVALAGYAARGSLGAGNAATQSKAVHAAPGTVLRQDNPDLGTAASIVQPSPEQGRSTGHGELP